jgi:hypothetical protein
MRARHQWLASCIALGLSSCAAVEPHFGHPGQTTASLESAGLLITEVAQSTDYGGTTADRVEVYCARAAGCDAFKVCDSGSSCATQLALGARARAVISRGSFITSSDSVWLASASGVELPDTRVGPFPCTVGQSQARRDCAGATFSECGPAGLGASSGACTPGEFPEAFQSTVRFTTNQHGGPEATCNRPICQDLRAAIDAAENSIDFAIYGVHAQADIIDALAAAHA